MRPVDSHCHLDFEQFDGDREEVIERAREKLEFIAVAGSDLEQNGRVLQLADEHPEFIKPNLGLHPTHVDGFDRVDRIKKQIREKDPPAIGEIGLDHYHIDEAHIREKQKNIFRELLKLAEELEKPVVVHSREAEKISIDILKDYDLPEIMLHCFNGKKELAEEAVSEGMKIGVTTQVLYSSHVQNLVRGLDVKNLLLETDSPYLYQGERNEPINVLESAEKISQIKEISEKKVVRASTKNARSVFK